MQLVAVPMLFLALLTAPVSSGEVSPISKVLQMISDLQSKVIGEGESSQKVYEEFSEWCEERSKNLAFEINTGKAEVADLEAAIAYEASLIGSFTAKIEELSGAIAADEADLAAASKIREKEASDFAASEKDLSEIIDTLQRAIGILEREMSKSGGSLLQLKHASSVAQALGVMVEASVLNSADAQRLTSLVQSSQATDDEDIGAPAGDVYKGQSRGIIETMEGLLEKAQSQLDAARKAETTALHNFELLKQSLEDHIKFGNKDLVQAKKGSAGSGEKKATAEGDLAVTSKELKADIATLADLHHTCMTKAEEFEAETKSRDEELKALADAKKVLTDTTSGATTLSYGLDQVSFLEVAQLRMSSGADLANVEAVRFIRDLAKKQKSPVLAQLAKRMASVISSGSGADVFAKVKGLIRDLISRLEDEAAADATHEAYCDKEIAESNVKHDDKTAEIAKLTSAIDQMSAKSAQLKAEVAELMQALADLAASQAEMDKIRQEEHELFVSNKADMEQGLEGVKLALKILTEYYASEDKAHVAAEGAGGGIIGLLEVIESDFTKGLAGMTADEESAQASYEQQTKANEIDKANKEQDLKYKSKEAKDLDKAVAEDSSDRATVQSELDAVDEYLARLHEECDEKVEPYAERKRRREAELAGLKEALEILSGEAVLLQQRVSRGILRAVRSHARVAA